ncbi:polysaccharide pyruvyl transferase family protein [Blastochloris sulfoviridis]|uniref:Polysaccharide pyruvyl transferase family protein n=1 Tax=Blastochloris sulfoviridis TaxID=50712 RepID=A0A5M6HJB2_9HYPH|nr:polysaccharide pyruvyl transferase family protein [Blastochloris sulfoviridis]KAA5595963.1 polysaccharide pyruvyl transferase family protein [Blastochloris sulfoviridis]
MRIAVYSGSYQVPDSFENSSEHIFNLCGGNTGNFAIIYGLFRMLDSAASVVEIVPWSIDPVYVNENFDLVIFACANMLGPHTDLGPVAPMLKAVDLPIIAVGLGAQAKSISDVVEIPAGTRQWLDVIAEAAPSGAPNIGVRGDFTYAQLERIGLSERAIVTGCPSILLNLNPELGAQISGAREKSIFRVAVPAGLPYWPELMLLERNLVQIVESTSGIYVGQHDIDMIRLCRRELNKIKPEILGHFNRYIAPGKSEAEFERWCQRYAVCFNSAPAWMEAMKSFDFVVGARFHGIMLALQAGVPAGVIAHDSRTVELCQTMAIPFRLYQELKSDFKASELYDLFPFDEHAFSMRRKELAERFNILLAGGGVYIGDRYSGVLNS